MAFNPLVDQGFLNKLKANVFILDAPELNVSPSFLGKNMIRLALSGDATAYSGTATGAVPSLEPYLMASISIDLLKTQSLSDLYKRRMELNTRLGDITVTPDTDTLSPYTILNCSIASVGELSFAGADPGYGVMLTGYYIINAAAWN